MVVCRSRAAAEEARAVIAAFLGRLKLELHGTKTRVVDMAEEGFDFLGFHYHRRASRRTGRQVPYAWPSQKAMRNVRQKLRALTARSKLYMALVDVIASLNQVICGWRTYFGVGNSTKKLADLDRYVRYRLWHLFRQRCGSRGRLTVPVFREWERRSGLTYFYPQGISGLRLRMP